jgi:hypothetical protein
VLLLSNIVVGYDAHLQLDELVPTSLNVDMTNFLSFDVYDIDLSKVMNDSNLNFIFVTTKSKLAESSYKIGHHGIANEQ